MFPIELSTPSQEFAQCWQTAGRHLNIKGDGAINWLKAELTPPFLEHLSFRLGNQLFYIRLVDVDEQAQMRTRAFTHTAPHSLEVFKPRSTCCSNTLAVLS